MLGLTNDELNRVTASEIHIGSSAAGPITISNAIDTSGTNTTYLFSARTVSQTAPIAEQTLVISAPQGVMLTDPANEVGNLSITATGGDIAYTDSTDLVVDNASTNSGSITITSGRGGVTGNMTVNGVITGGAAKSILLAGTNQDDGMTLNANKLIQTADGKISFAFDNIHIAIGQNARVIAGGTSAVEIHTLKSATKLTLGAPDQTSGVQNLKLSQGEFDAITAPGGIEIEVSNTSATSVDVVGGITLAQAKIPKLHLKTAGGMRDSGAAVLSADQLELTSGANGIGGSGTPLLINTTTLAATAADGDIFITESNGTTIGSVTVDGQTVTGVTTTGATGGSITLTVTNGSLQLDEQVNASGTNHDVILDANSSGAAANVVFNTNAANVTAADDVHVQAANAITRTAATTGKLTGDQVFLDAVSIGTSANPILTAAATLGIRTNSASNADAFVKRRRRRDRRHGQ